MEGEVEAASQLLGCLTVVGSERKAVFVLTAPPVLPHVDDQSILPPSGSSLCYWIHDYPDDRARASFLEARNGDMRAKEGEVNATATPSPRPPAMQAMEGRNLGLTS